MPDTATQGAPMSDVAPGMAPRTMRGAAEEQAAPREAAQGAATFIGNLGREGIQVLGPSVPPAQRTARFRQLFANDFDLPGISRFVLGPHAR